MSAQALDIKFADIDPAAAWPLRPWGETEDAPAGGTGAGSAAATDGPVARKARDRGASAVEWVVITAIVVAIVTGVGVLISKAVQDKAKNACTQIVSTDTTTGGSGSGC